MVKHAGPDQAELDDHGPGRAARNRNSPDGTARQNFVLSMQRRAGNSATTALLSRLAVQRECALDAPPATAEASTTEAPTSGTETAPTLPDLTAEAGLGTGGGGGDASVGGGTEQAPPVVTGAGETTTEAPATAGATAAGPSTIGTGTTTGIARPMVRLGSKGLDVGHVQTLLNANGANPQLGTDGNFGPMTAAAVRAFQTQRGLTADAVVGPRTWSELDVGRDMAPPADATTTTTPGGATAPPTAPPGPTTGPGTAPAGPLTLRDALLAAMQQGVSVSQLANMMNSASLQDLAGLVSDPVFMAAYARYQDAQLRRALFERLFIQYWAYTSSAEALQAARDQVGSMFSVMSNASLQQTILGSRIQIHIIPRDKNLTDLPPFAGLTTTADGRDWSGVRGIHRRDGNISHVGIAEETLIGGNRVTVDPTTGARTETASGYGPGFMVSHETGHALKASSLTPSQDAAVEAAYAKHVRDYPLSGRQETHPNWLPPAWYAASNSQEYFAQGVSAWRGTPRAPTEAADFTQSNLAAIDPDLYNVLRTVFQS